MGRAGERPGRGALQHGPAGLRAVSQQPDHAAIARGGGVYTLLEGWLLEPRGYKGAPVIDIRVKAADGLSFATGLPKVGDAWRLSGTVVRFAGYSALGKFTLENIAVPMPGSLRPGQAQARWRAACRHARRLLRTGPRRSARLGEAHRRGRVELLAGLHRAAAAAHPRADDGRKRGVGFGRTEPGGGASVMVEVGADVDKQRLFNDWVLVHEMIHTGMPYIHGRGTWLMEGAATYVEPIIRARAGWKTEEVSGRSGWTTMPRGAPVFAMGLPMPRARENYWGGAIFMLMADLGIRRATKGAKGLEDCLGGRRCGRATRRSTHVRIRISPRPATASRCTDVVSALVDRYLLQQRPIDLAAFWRDLGVSEVGGRIALTTRRRRRVAQDDRHGPAAARSPKPVKLPWQS